MNAFASIRCVGFAASVTVALMAPLIGWAQNAESQPDSDENVVASTAANEDEDTTISLQEDKDWAVAIGLASFTVPRYSGDDDSEGLVVPNLELRYKDRLNLSFLTGLSYDYLNRGAWSAGPFFDYDFGRDTNAELIGFRRIDEGVEAGGFFEYAVGDVTAKVKVLRGFGGHDGTSITATLRHAKLYDTGVIPLYFLIGPAMRFGSTEYLNTFYGVTEQQSATSGLPQTSLNAGIISYGLDAVLVVPLSRNLFIRNFFLLERLTGDVADSPIVTNQGDEFQATTGIELGYLF